MKRAPYVLAALALIAAVNADAQGIAELPSGVRLRVTIRDSVRQDPYLRPAQSIIGTLVRATSDTLWIHVAGPDTLRLARATTAVQVSRGVSRTRSAVTHGVTMGLVLGSVFYSSADVHHRSKRDALAMAGLATLGGIVVGAWRPFESWRTVR